MKDKVDILTRLRWGEVPFANLRHKAFKHWTCGRGGFPACDAMTTRLELHRQEPLLVGGEVAAEDAVIIERMLARTTQYQWSALEAAQWVRFYWPLLLEDELGDIPAALESPCCNEFIVSAERIRVHSLRFYQTLLDRFHAMEEGCGANCEIGLAFALEYMLHVIFGGMAVHHPVDEAVLLRPR